MYELFFQVFVTKTHYQTQQFPGDDGLTHLQAATMLWICALLNGKIDPDGLASLDLNYPVFQKNLFTLQKAEWHAAIETLN